MKYCVAGIKNRSMQSSFLVTWCAVAVTLHAAPVLARYTLSRVAGTAASGYAGDGGPASAALLNHPEDLAIAADGALFIADTGNQRIRRISVDGHISTVAGSGAAGGGGDGGPAVDASLDNPVGVAVDAAGDIFIVDGSPLRVRRVDIRTGVITTLLGPGLWTYALTNDRQGNVLVTVAPLPSHPGQSYILNLAASDGVFSFVPLTTPYLACDDMGPYRVTTSDPSRTVIAFGREFEFAVANLNGPTLFVYQAEEYALGLPVDISLAPTGRLYFTAGAYYSQGASYVLEQHGAIFSSIAGGGCAPLTDGAPADTVALQPRALAAASTDLIYVVNAPSELLALHRGKHEPGIISGQIDVGSFRTVSVYAYGDDGSARYTRPNNRGRFRFSDVPPGRYAVVARFDEEGFTCDAANCGWSGASGDCPQALIAKYGCWTTQGLNNPEVAISAAHPRQSIRLRAITTFPCI